MVRASFRVGLRLGILVGVAFALYRTVQSRRATKEPAPEPWQPIVDTPRPRPQPEAPAAPTPPDVVDLRMPDVPPPRRPRDEVGEPIDEPAAPEPELVVEPDPEPEVVIEPEPEPEPQPVVEPEPVMEAEPFLDAAPPATLVVGDPHPLDVVPEPAAAAAPVKKAAKRAAKAAAKTEKAAKKAAKKSAAGKKVAPTAAATRSEPEPPAVPAWVKPAGGICPKTHPVKAKLASRLFHLPGMLAYDRTHADRCYRDEDAALGEGFIRAKR